jgi:DNA-binding CsgD family transcriptional regulator
MSKSYKQGSSSDSLELSELIKNIWKVKTTEDVDKNQHSIDHKSILEFIADALKVRIMITDLESAVIVYSSNLLSNYDSTDSFQKTNMTIDESYNIVPSDFRDIFIKQFDCQIEYISRISIDHILSYRCVRQVRLVNKDGDHIRLQIKDSVLETNNKGQVKIVLHLIENSSPFSNDIQKIYQLCTASGIPPSFMIFPNKVESDQQINVDSLSRAELEVLRNLMIDDETIVVAEKMRLSPATIATHKRTLFRKLGVKSITSLVKVVSLMGIDNWESDLKRSGRSV